MGPLRWPRCARRSRPRRPPEAGFRGRDRQPRNRPHQVASPRWTASEPRRAARDPPVRLRFHDDRHQRVVVRFISHALSGPVDMYCADAPCTSDQPRRDRRPRGTPSATTRCCVPADPYGRRRTGPRTPRATRQFPARRQEHRPHPGAEHPPSDRTTTETGLTRAASANRSQHHQRDDQPEQDAEGDGPAGSRIHVRGAPLDSKSPSPSTAEGGGPVGSTSSSNGGDVVVGLAVGSWSWSSSVSASVLGLESLSVRPW